MLSNPLANAQATSETGLDIKNCDSTLFSSIRSEGTTIRATKNIGTHVSTRNQNLRFLAFTMKFFRIAAAEAAEENIIIIKTRSVCVLKKRHARQYFQKEEKKS